MSGSFKAEFGDVAAAPHKAKPKRRRPYSLSVRLSDEERDLLKRKAGKRSLGAYMRHAALGDEQYVRRKSKPRPSLDAALFAQMLGKLGQSDQVRCLLLLLAATEDDRVVMTDEDSDALQAACDDIHQIRLLLFKELGLRGDGS